MSFINLKTFPFEKNQKYSFVYNKMFYCSEFISKENEMNVFPKTIFEGWRSNWVYNAYNSGNVKTKASNKNKYHLMLKNNI